MTSLVVSLGGWSWIVAGLALLILEVLAPGAFMMWLGLAALIVGIVSLTIDWSWQAQFVVFALLSVASIPLWRRFGRAVGPRSDQPFLNRRADALVGHSYVLDQPIVDGTGRLRVDDTLWQVHGPDVPAGTRVRVTAADGATLTVARDN
ncbi:MAG: NfeD family protein [Pseudolabrys sp.]